MHPASVDHAATTVVSIHGSWPAVLPALALQGSDGAVFDLQATRIAANLVQFPLPALPATNDVQPYTLLVDGALVAAAPLLVGQATTPTPAPLTPLLPLPSLPLPPVRQAAGIPVQQVAGQIVDVVRDDAVACGTQWSSTIWGQVVDVHGAGIGGAVVRVLSVDGVHAATTNSDASGHWSIGGLGCTQWTVYLDVVPGLDQWTAEPVLIEHLNGGQYSGAGVVWQVQPAPVSLVQPLDVAAEARTALAVATPADQLSVLLDGASSLDAASIDAILGAGHSPAVGTGQLWIDAGSYYGIDPAVALAFFAQESSLGTDNFHLLAHGAYTYNIGNITCSPNWTGSCKGRFRVYGSWADGINDWFRLIRNEYAARGLWTVETIIPVYAPAWENDVESYISNVRARVARWRGY